jgi:hypothetical protein
MLSDRIRSLQKHTWIDDLPTAEQIDAHKALMLLVAAASILPSALIIALKNEPTSVNLSVAGAIALVGICALVYGVHDLREQYHVYRREHAHAYKARRAHLCASKERLHPKARRHMTSEVSGASFVDMLERMNAM